MTTWQQQLSMAIRNMVRVVQLKQLIWWQAQTTTTWPLPSQCGVIANLMATACVEHLEVEEVPKAWAVSHVAKAASCTQHMELDMVRQA